MEHEDHDHDNLSSSVRDLIRWVKITMAAAVFACLLQFGTAVGLVTQAGKTTTRLASLRDENASLRTENAKLRNELNRGE